MIKYEINGKITPGELNGFFKGWRSAPSLCTKKKLLHGSELVITARDNDDLIGFLAAISDGIMHAFITLVEVLDSHKGRGIGRKLMEIAVRHFTGLYQIVLITDTDKIGFYEKCGFKEICGMLIQNFDYENKR